MVYNWFTNIKGEKMTTSNRWTTVKLNSIQVEEIDKLKKDNSLKYRNRSEFFQKAIDKEVEFATLSKGLNDQGKIFFKDLMREYRMNAFFHAKYLSSSMTYQRENSFYRDAINKQKEVKNKILGI